MASAIRLRWTAVLSTLLLVSGAALSGAAENQIAWQQDLTTAFRSAQEANRPLVVLLSKENCPNCSRLKAETLNEQGVIERLNSDYVSIRLDGPQHPKLLQKTGVKVYPTILVINPDNQLLGKIDGFVDGTTLERRLEQFQATHQAQSAQRSAR